MAAAEGVVVVVPAGPGPLMTSSRGAKNVAETGQRVRGLVLLVHEPFEVQSAEHGGLKRFVRLITIVGEIRAHGELVPGVLAHGRVHQRHGNHGIRDQHLAQTISVDHHQSNNMK